jgi:hypothetical protein
VAGEVAQLFETIVDGDYCTEPDDEHAVELAREGVPLIVIQRQVGHSNLGITSIYLSTSLRL